MVSGFRRRLSFRVLSVVVAFVLILPQGALAAQPRRVSDDTPAAPAPPDVVAAETPLAATATLTPTVAAEEPPDTATATPALTVPLTPTATVEVPSVYDVTPTPTPFPEEPSAPLTGTTRLQATVGPEGGEVSAPASGVHIAFPPGAVDRELALQVDVSVPESLAPVGRTVTWLQLEVAAMDAALQDEGHLVLAQPVTLTFDLRGFPGWMTPALLHAVEGEEKAWEVVPSRWDAEGQVLTAQVARFSGYQITGASDFPDDGTHYLLRNLPDVSTFSGAASYAYALTLPPGRHGMAPNLSLSYNSGALNGLLGVVQSGSVGLGWSLGGVVEIVRPVTSNRVCWVECNEWGCGEQCEGEIRWGFRNAFQLLIGGASHYLKGPERLANNGGCRYYAEGAPELRVLRYTAPGTAERPYCGYGAYGAPPNGGKEFWVVTTADGTTYRLGYDGDAEQLVRMDTYNATACQLSECPWDYWRSFGGYGGEVNGRVAYRWSADQVEDVYGNRMTLGYTEGLRDGWEREHQLDWIRYTGTASAAGAILVDVVYENRTTANDGGSGGSWHDDGLRGETLLQNQRPWAMWDEQRVDRIRVCVGASGTTCPSTGIYAEYDLDYQCVDEEYPGLEWIVNTVPHETTRLVAITRTGWNAAGQAQSLPAATFGYGNGGSASFTQVDDSGDPADGGYFGYKLRYPRMLSASNGYGGTVGFTYNSGTPYNYRHVHSTVVTQRNVSDGLGHTGATTYTYTDPCFSGHEGWPNCRRGDVVPEASYGLVGHKQTTVEVRDYDNRVLSKQVQAFHVGKSVLQGQPYQTQVYAGSTLLQQEVTFWSIQKFGPASLGATVGRAVQTQSTDHTVTPVARQRTETVYDAYGNPTATYTREYVDGAGVSVATSGFEAGGGWGSWSPFWSPTPASITTEQAHGGQYSLKLQQTASDGGACQDISGLAVGQAYTIRAWVKADVDATAQFELWIHDTSGANAQYSGWVLPGSGWQQVETMYIANATGRIRIHLYFSPGSGAIYVDDVSVSRAEGRRNERSVHRDTYNLTASRWRVGLVTQEAVFEGICRYDQVDIAFINDAVINGQDRNLYVDYLTVGDTTVQAEGASVRLDRGAGAAAFDGEDVIAGREGVVWNGALRVHTTAPYNVQQIVVRAYGTPAGGVYP